MLTDQAKFLQTIAATFVASAYFAGLAFSMPAGDKATNSAKASKAPNDSPFGKELLAIAAEYKSYGKVDDWARWAPTRCAFSPPPVARLSASKDSGTHGKKVYFLYAKNRDQYFKNEPPQPGQVVVKESWYPSAEGKSIPAPSDKQLGLFIMMKLDPKTPGSDNGWVYGTVTPDGKSVTSAGRVQSCMECHTSVPNDRLFGLAK